MSEIKVNLEQFEGPLALLLFLIRKEEMNIFDINILRITDQYLAFVKNMKTLDLEGAGDFIAMAATLIQIKSKMLMPAEALDEEDENLEDPRKELVDKLLEYKKFQEVSKELYERPLLGRDVWSKGYKEKSLGRPEDIVKVDDNPLYALVIHYKRALKGVKKTIHRVGAKIQSIASRVLELKTFLPVNGKTSLKKLSEVSSDFTTEPSSRLLITFLSMLELSKMGYARLFQSQNYADIHINMKKEIEGDVLSQVDEYEDLNETLKTDLFEDSKIEINPSETFSEDHEFKQEDMDSQGVDEVLNGEATDEEIEKAEVELSL